MYGECFRLYNKKNKSKLIYPNLLFAIRPIPYGTELTVPIPSESFETILDHDNSLHSDDHSTNDKDFQLDTTNDPQLFNQL